MKSSSRCKRAHYALYVCLFLVQQNLVGFNAARPKSRLDCSVTTGVEDDPGSH